MSCFIFCYVTLLNMVITVFLIKKTRLKKRKFTSVKQWKVWPLWQATHSAWVSEDSSSLHVTVQNNCFQWNVLNVSTFGRNPCKILLSEVNHVGIKKKKSVHFATLRHTRERERSISDSVCVNEIKLRRLETALKHLNKILYNEKVNK